MLNLQEVAESIFEDMGATSGTSPVGNVVNDLAQGPGDRLGLASRQGTDKNKKKKKKIKSFKSFRKDKGVTNED